MLVTLRRDSVDVFDPSESALEPETRSSSVATRSDSLVGKTLAVIDNGAGRGFVDLLVEKVRKLAQLGDVLYVLKDTVNVPPRPEDWAEVLKRGDVGLTLYGA